MIKDVISIVAGFIVAQLADHILGIKDLTEQVAGLVHGLTGRPPWTVGAGQ